jgi:entericidin A
MTDNRREFLAAGAILLCGALLGGCNTVEGVGKDIENAGDAIEDEAREQRRRN